MADSVNEISRANLDFDKLFNRFMLGEVGKRFSSVMQDSSVQKCFERELVNWSQKIVSEEKNKDIAKRFAEVTSKETLKANLEVNVVNGIFQIALAEWMNSEDSLDDIIISMLTVSNVKSMVFEIQKMFYKIYETFKENAENEDDESDNSVAGFKTLKATKKLLN